MAFHCCQKTIFIFGIQSATQLGWLLLLFGLFVCLFFGFTKITTPPPPPKMSPLCSSPQNFRPHASQKQLVIHPCVLTSEALEVPFAAFCQRAAPCVPLILAKLVLFVSVIVHLHGRLICASPVSAESRIQFHFFPPASRPRNCWKAARSVTSDVSGADGRTGHSQATA